MVFTLQFVFCKSTFHITTYTTVLQVKYSKGHILEIYLAPYSNALVPSKLKCSLSVRDLFHGGSGCVSEHGEECLIVSKGQNGILIGEAAGLSSYTSVPCLSNAHRLMVL